MFKKNLSLISIIFMTMVTTCTSWAALQETNYPSLNAPMAELGIMPGTRVNSLGQTGAVASQDLEGLYWNPAGLAALKTPGLELAHTTWFQDIFQEEVGLGLPWGPGALGLGVQYISLGVLEKTYFDSNGDINTSAQNIQMNAWGMRLGYGLGFGQGWRLGGSALMHIQTLGENSLSTVVMNLGMQYQPVVTGFRLGALVKNLGSAVAGYSLPLGAQAGAGYGFGLGSGHVLLGLAEVESNAGAIISHLGLEYTFQKALALRVGYALSETPGITAGVGYTAGSWSFGYAYVPIGVLGVSHRISINMLFDAPGEANSNDEPTGHGHSGTTAGDSTEPVDEIVPDDNHGKPTAKNSDSAGPSVEMMNTLEKKLLDFQKKITTGKLHAIQFKTGKATIEKNAMPTLDFLGKLLEQYSRIRVRIEGHTDNVGDVNANKKLSQRRVDKVREYLIQNFTIDSNNLISVSYGMTRPIASNKNEKGRKKNRRIEFHVIQD